MEDELNVQQLPGKRSVRSNGQIFKRDYIDRNPQKYWELYQMGLEPPEISKMFDTAVGVIKKTLLRYEQQYPIGSRWERKIKTIRSLVASGRKFDLAFKSAFCPEEIDELKVAGYQAPRIHLKLNIPSVTEKMVVDVYGSNVVIPTVLNSADMELYYQNRARAIGQTEFVLLQEILRRVREDSSGVSFKDLVSAFKEIHKAGQLARGMPTDSKATFKVNAKVDLTAYKHPKLVEHDTGQNPLRKVML